jgi:hypothetical protein
MDMPRSMPHRREFFLETCDGRVPVIVLHFSVSKSNICHSSYSKKFE